MSQSQKTLEFLQKLKDSSHWNEDYDYSEVDYINATSKIIIIDKLYNSKHLISPDRLLSRNTKCVITNAINVNQFIIKVFQLNHSNFYDYQKFKFIDTKTKSIIICPIHGEFKQSYALHSKGIGCSKCGIKKSSDAKRYDLNFLLEKIRESGNWNDEYDYSKINYINSQTKVKVIYKKYNTEHLVSPMSLVEGVSLNIINADNPTDFFIANSKEIHGEKYDYSKTKYKNAQSKVIVFCNKHKEEFNIRATNHLQGIGCKKCGIEKSAPKLFTTEGVIEDFKKVHGEKYDYSKVKYIGVDNKISIICQIHGEFQQNPSAHKRGAGCYVCAIGWRAQDIIRYVNDITNKDVLMMDPIELNMLIAQGKLPEEFEQLVFTLEGTKENSLKTLKENLGIDDTHELSDLELENLSDKLESMTTFSYDDEINDALVATETLSDEDSEFLKQEERKRKGLPSISNEDILVLDKELINTCDDEAVEFFIQYKLKRVWNEVINDKREVKDIKDLNGGKNSSRLRDLFLSEYKKVVDYIPPSGYNFKRNGEIALPNMMQKLTVQRVIDYKRYGNWSGTGAGKTISFIIASREVNSRLTIVICINSTVSQLEEDILEVYPDSKIFTHFKKGQKFNRDNYNYLLLNYEKFQQGYTEEIFQDLNENNLIDFIVLDEVHNAKQRDKDESIRRGALMRLIGRSAEMNPNFHLLGMSATPVINNLIEAKSLLQLITGKDYDDISTRGTITNALKIFNQLLLNGIRYIPKYDIVLKELTAENAPALNIDGTKLTEKLKDNDNKDYLGLEKILLESKLEVLDKFLKPKTIIYTYFTDNDKIPKRIAKYVKSKGYSCGIYIGEQSTEDRELSKTSFVKGDVDILIASRIIGTGVDGLQNVCNRMILLTLPWTDSEYTQLKGRIYRQGSKFGDVEIVIPQVFVDLEDKRWSWDKQRLQLIREKRTLADAAVDGIIPSKHIPSREKLCSDSLQALNKWKKRVSEGKITTIERKDLVLPLRPEILEYLKPSLGDFSEMNKSWSVSRSENTQSRLKADPSEWYYYHSLYAEKRKEWSEIPYIEIAKKIKERPEWVVADMGCGENLMSKELTNKVHAFDYVAIDKDVIACDMSSVPLNSNEVDAVIFCLSLMGSNYLDYLKEAFRIIKPYGNLFICEPKKKIDNRIEEFKKDIESVGFKIIEVNSQSSKFIYFQGIKL